jgi:hypothetical protein
MSLTRWTMAGAVALLGAVLSAGPARAQTAVRPGVGSPPAAPTVSPYINLLRSGNSAAANYFGLVRPQLETNTSLQSLQQQVLTGPNRLPTEPGLPEDVFITGHAAVFMNTGGFFQSSIGGLGGLRSQLPTRPVPNLATAATPAAPTVPHR